MGKGSPKVQVTEYFLSQHFGVCMGIPDALKEVRVEDKVAFEGSVSTAEDVSINRPDLFGGIKKEGGVAGTMRVLPGEPDQLLTDALAQKLGRSSAAETPGFRGYLSLFFTGSTPGRGFYWRANQPFIPAVAATVQRILKRSGGSEQWYVDKAAIDSCGGEEFTFDTSTWRYLVGGDPGNCVDFDEFVEPTYEAPGFDDSGWSENVMPFGSVDWSTLGSGVTKPSEFGFRDATNEVWPFHRILHLRRTLTLTTVPEAIVFDAFIDNGWELWVNGEPVFADPVPTASNRSTQIVPGSFFVVGANTIYIRASDTYCGASGERTALDLRTRNTGSLDMNPAHIVHECLTDTDWGMGTPLSALDDTSFRAAADTLFDESFGLSLKWVRQSTIESFIQEVLDHINAVLYTDPETGLLTIDLIRGDYDPDTLDTLTPDNADLTNFSRKLWGDITNEIIVTWTNPESEKEETITVQDDASIGIQGGIVSGGRNYYGVRCAELALRLGYRDLASDGQPLATIKAIVNRSQYLLRPASVVKVTWPEKGLTNVVFRVTAVDYGKPGQPEIEVDMIEDVFGLDIGEFDRPASSIWEDPSRAPEPFDEQLAFTLPYFFTVNSVLAELVDSPEYPEVGAGILVRTSNPDAFEFELWDEVALPNGSTELQSLTENSIPGSGTLSGDLIAEATSTNVEFEDLSGQATPVVGGFVIISSGAEETAEIAMVEAVGATYTLSRGVLDTVPRAWTAGTRVWFLDESTVYEDPIVRSGGELVDYRALMRTSQGRLGYDAASTFSRTLTDRFWLPLRPADVKVEGVAFSSEDDPVDATGVANPWVTVTWANRNREEEDITVLTWTDASATPEAGQTTVIEVRDVDGNLLTTHDALSGTSFDVPDASFGAETLVEFRVYSSRADGSLVLDSLQYVSHWVLVSSLARLTHSEDVRRTHDGGVRVIHP